LVYISRFGILDQEKYIWQPSNGPDRAFTTRVTRLGEFAHWVIVYFGKFFKLQKYFHGYCYEIVLTKMGWATFWAIFYKLNWSPCLQRKAKA
jgi:hypothetical protein